MTNPYRSVLEEPAAAVRAWQDDLRSAGASPALPVPDAGLPEIDAGILLDPLDLGTLPRIPVPGGLPEEAAPAAPPTAPGPQAQGPPAPRRPPALIPAGASRPAGRRDGGPQRAAPAAWAAPPDGATPATPATPAAPAAPAAPGGADAARPARKVPPASPAVPQPWPAAVPQPWPPAGAPPGPGTDRPGAGAARLATLLQRYDLRDAAGSPVAAEVSSQPAAATSPAGAAPPSGDPGPGRRAVPGPTVVALPGRAAALRRRLDSAEAEAAARPFAAIEATVAHRLHAWTDGVPVPAVNVGTKAAGRSSGAWDASSMLLSPPVAGPRPPAHPSPGPPVRGGGLPPHLTADRTPDPAPEAPAARHLARLIGLVEQAVGDLATIERRLADLAARPAEPAAPAVEWLEDDDLAARLQGILSRQARQRGIDLS